YLAIKQSSETNLTSGRFGLLASPAVLCRYNLALVRAECGRFEEAIADGLDAVRLAEVGNHPYALVTACLGLGYAHKVKGDYRQALSVLERGLSLSRDWSLTLLSPLITWHVGHARALEGHVGEGLSLLQGALDAHEAAG